MIQAHFRAGSRFPTLQVSDAFQRIEILLQLPPVLQPRLICYLQDQTSLAAGRYSRTIGFFFFLCSSFSKPN
ncbi:hypothetical protein CMV_029714 [Castanea mollissima]|uniref:Uncharacterized protein n=1 Tax=Castanea mollissima TaxID=60419 RepID=A0A8J4Q910_9ROSI|nr:hypothetical protein CMV_029714 [Castanea mollissima]